MFYDRSEPGFPQWYEDVLKTSSDFPSRVSPEDGYELGREAGEEIFEAEELIFPGVYDRALVESIWEFAEIVPGNDPDLWRKDECGDWMHRLDYGKRSSEFGWEIFDPGVGRHSQGVFAMRPMQWKNFLRQYDVFG